MVHFYAIALFRRNEYRAAGVPVLSLVGGVKRTVFELRGYMLLFGVVVTLLGLSTRVGFVFMVVLLAYLLIWIRQSTNELWLTNPERWGRGVFGTSLTILLIISALLALTPLTP
jgi:protoheme IX farnesyltransferase